MNLGDGSVVHIAKNHIDIIVARTFGDCAEQIGQGIAAKHLLLSDRQRAGSDIDDPFDEPQRGLGTCHTKLPKGGEVIAVRSKSTRTEF